MTWHPMESYCRDGRPESWDCLLFRTQDYILGFIHGGTGEVRTHHAGYEMFPRLVFRFHGLRYELKMNPGNNGNGILINRCVSQLVFSEGRRIMDKDPKFEYFHSGIRRKAYNDNHLRSTLNDRCHAS